MTILQNQMMIVLAVFVKLGTIFPDITFLSKRGQRKGLPIEHGVRYGRWFRRLSITPWQTC